MNKENKFIAPRKDSKKNIKNRQNVQKTKKKKGGILSNFKINTKTIIIVIIILSLLVGAFLIFNSQKKKTIIENPEEIFTDSENSVDSGTYVPPKKEDSSESSTIEEVLPEDQNISTNIVYTEEEDPSGGGGGGGGGGGEPPGTTETDPCDNLGDVVFSHNNIIYNEPIEVTLSYTHPNSNCNYNIKYTTDGSNPSPTNFSIFVESPITVPKTTTIKAAVFAKNLNEQDISGRITTKLYIINKITDLCLNPGYVTFSHPDNVNYNNPISVVLSYTNTTCNYYIRYTIDGTTPNFNSNIYSSPIELSNTTTINAAIFLKDNSEIHGPISKKTYTINIADTPPIIEIDYCDQGTGTINDPIIICTPEKLNNIRNNLGLHYTLGQNINLNVSPYNSGDGWQPIGTLNAPFTGSLNGQNYTISNLYINRPTTDYVGLFGYASNADIDNIILENINITGSKNTGALIGYSNLGNINNISTNGTITGDLNTGGLIGSLSGQLNNSNYTNGTVAGKGNVGGLVGILLENGKISDSYTNNTINLIFGIASYIGGIAGWGGGDISNSHSSSLIFIGNNSNYPLLIGGITGLNAGITIDDCYYSGTINISGSHGLVGGIAGANNSYGVISKSYFSGTITNVSSSAGGITSSNMGTISNSYSAGNISGGSRLGGLVSSNIVGGKISNCYSTSNVTGTGIEIGGFAYKNQSSSSEPSIIENSYSSGTVSGTDKLGGFISYLQDGTISNCYSLGNVIRTSGGRKDNFGGFIGYSDNLVNTTVTNNYSIGRVSGNNWTPTNKGFSGTTVLGSGNYWDIETSLQTTSSTGATGRTTEEMKTPESFEGWDFINIWNINSNINNGYPYLRNNAPE